MKKNELGFGVVEGILVVIIISILGFVGWYVWHVKNNITSTMTSTVSTVSSPITNKTTVTNQPQTTKYLKIKELGVEIPLQTGLTDLEYAYGVQPSRPLANSLFFGSSSLDVADSQCKISVTNDYSPIGYVLILKAKSTNAGTGDSQDGTLVANNVNGYYLYYKEPQVLCSNSSSIHSLEQKQIMIFQTELKGTKIL